MKVDIGPLLGSMRLIPVDEMLELILTTRFLGKGHKGFKCEEISA